MANFKIGEKVVCVSLFNAHCPTHDPKVNEIVTIQSFHESRGILYLKISEYLFDKYGEPQNFTSLKFRKLDYEFAENLLKEISESVNKKHLQN